MCKAMEDAMDEVRNETATQIAVNMLEIGKLTFEEIAQCSNLTVEDVTELAKKYGLMTV